MHNIGVIKVLLVTHYSININHYFSTDSIRRRVDEILTNIAVWCPAS